MNEAPLRWLRLWTDILGDPKVRMLAFEDRWHFVAILCMKRRGDLDCERELLDRVVGVTLGVGDKDRDEIKRRLMAVTLINSRWQPKGWDKRQFHSDQSDPTAAERMRRYRDRHRNGRNADTAALLPDQSQIRSEQITPNPSLPSVRGKGDFGNTHEPIQANGSNGRESRLDARDVYRKLIASDGAFMRGDQALEGALERIGGWSAIRERRSADERRIERAFCTEFRRLRAPDA